MKRILGLVLCLVLLAGCAPAGDPDGLFGTGQVGDGGGTVCAASDVPYNWTNLLKALPGGAFCDTGDTILFDYSHDGLVLMEYDKRTGTVDYFCKDATCRHDPANNKADANCAAATVDSCIENVDGVIYGEASDGELRRLENGRFVPTAVSGASGYRHQNGQLYAYTPDYTLVRLDEQGEPQTILREMIGGPFVMIGEYCYIADAPGLVRVRVEGEGAGMVETVREDSAYAFEYDGTYLYYCHTDSSLWRCALDGSDPVLVSKDPVWPPSVNFDSEYIYFAPYPADEGTPEAENNRKFYRRPLDLSDEATVVADLPEPARTVYGFPGFEKVFVQTANALYTLDVRDGKVTQVVFPWEK